MLQTKDVEQELLELLDDLETIQLELIEILTEKRKHIAAGDLKEFSDTREREDDLCRRLQACHDRRSSLLEAAASNGLQADSIRQLSATFSNGDGATIQKRAEKTSAQMRVIQHHSLSNWVLAQRSLIHISQLLEIVATGGRICPTYGSVETVHGRGSLVDQEA